MGSGAETLTEVRIIKGTRDMGDCGLAHLGVCCAVGALKFRGVSTGTGRLKQSRVEMAQGCFEDLSALGRRETNSADRRRREAGSELYLSTCSQHEVEGRLGAKILTMSR